MKTEQWIYSSKTTSTIKQTNQIVNQTWSFVMHSKKIVSSQIANAIYTYAVSGKRRGKTQWNTAINDE